ncbi:MAG TPA: S8 family serine peptidase, partial [Xanthomonadales bacterium]|nr:S8 family serine peptidase [Xanthomonadales bacterium]
TTFAKSTREPLVGVLIELESPAFTATHAKGLTGKALQRAATEHHAKLAREQDDFIARANAAGVPLLLRTKHVPTGKGETMRIEYRLSYLLDAIVAYVPESKLGALRALPGVRSVTQPARTRFFLDNSVNYALGSQASVASRRVNVYGATEELGPSGTNANGPAATPVDGFEGQGINIGVVDSGLDYEHPMFGGTGVTTLAPQRPPAASGANRKVTYWYNLGGATTLDDFGHGTHVASTAAGYVVDGNTPNVVPTGSAPFGPTPGGVRMHGVAPQAKLQGWPVCNAAGNCTGDIELGIEDAVSPVILTGAGDGNSVPVPGPVAKPVSDVINLSLGGGNDPAAATSRVSNNAVLATGAVVVAAAGNDGPGAATVGAPCVGAMVICAASVLDPGSTAGSDVLGAGEIANELCTDTGGTCVTPAPDDETGATSDANALALGERAGIRSFKIAGGGDIPGGSVSAHYVYVDRDQPTVPSQVTGRIALLDGGTGTFAQIVNPVAALNPSAILLITDTTSATALAVVNDVPAYTIAITDGEYLKSILRTGGGTPGHGAVSRLPLRVKSSISLEAFTGAVSDFSSRGPNAHANGEYRTIKPDIAGLGQGVLAATTPTGNTDGLLGMANASGYTIANGTSMASPHVAGAAALVRQRVRALGFDSIDLNDPAYRAKRFRASTLVRAMLSNTATDLRTGQGSADPAGPNPPYTIHDIGAGLIDIDAALKADAIMTSPTTVFDVTPNEYTAPDTGDLPVPIDATGNAIVPLPTASFGNVEVLGATQPRVRERLVTIEAITAGGAGTYNLTRVDDVGSNHPDLTIEFRSADGNAAISSVVVPASGSATFMVRVTAEGDGTLTDGYIATWYVNATHATSTKRLRMPFLWRAVGVPVPSLGLPSNPVITDAGAPNSAGCAVDTDNSFGVSWSYTQSGDALAPIGYRVQRGTFETELFFDDTSEPLVAGENTLWLNGATPPTWSSANNPDTGDSAYFVPDTSDQEDALTLKVPLAIPGNALGASLQILTRVDTESGFDFANVQANADGGAYSTLGRFSGTYSGFLNFDATGFVGTAMGIQLLMTSDQLVPGVGWWVDQLRVFTNDFVTIGDVPASTTTQGPESLPGPGTRRYRIAGRYDVDGGEVVGPYTQSACACVPLSAFGDLPQDLLLRDSFEDTGSIIGTTCQ